MPIHIKGAGGADKSKGLTATKYDIAHGKTALVSGAVVTGCAITDVFCSPEDTEGTGNASRSITFEDSLLTGNINQVIYRRESFDPDDANALDHRVVKANTVHTFQTWWGMNLDETGEVDATVEYFSSTSSTKLTIKVLTIAYEYTEGVLKLTLPSGYYFEGEWLHADILMY